MPPTALVGFRFVDRTITRNRATHLVAILALIALVAGGSAADAYAATPPGVSSITASFNSTPIPAGQTIWFTAAINAWSWDATPTTIAVTGATIQFTANGTAYTVAVPDARVVFWSSGASATSYDSRQRVWSTTVNRWSIGRAFLVGVALPVPPGGLPGGTGPITWTGTFSADKPGVVVSWQWAAAAYGAFTSDANQLGVKPVDDFYTSSYRNLDPAGSPERVKAHVTAGARGAGGVNYTGSPTSLALVTAGTAPANHAPIANAGPDRTVRVGEVVRLDGSASSDIDGDPLTFTWTLVSAPDGAWPVLQGADTSSPSFGITLPGSYTFRLVVRDASLSSIPDDVTITTTNSPPVAKAGPDQTAVTGATVQLDASASTDVDGDPLSYRWTLASRPPGSGAELNDPAAMNPSFVLDLPGQYVVSLIVNDGQSDSVTADEVCITTSNSPPRADAGASRTAVVGHLVQLDGSHSTDVDGNPLTYRWSLQGPEGSAAALSSATALDPSFVPDLLGDYRIQLIVNDGQVDSEPVTITITTENSAPLAEAGPDQSVVLGTTVRLDGTGSTDSDGQPLRYAWSITSRPSGSEATLSAPNEPITMFTADCPGDYVIQLVVNDGWADSRTPDTVHVSTINSKPVAVAGPEQRVDVGSTVQVDASASSDADGDPLTYRWSLIARPPDSVAQFEDATAGVARFVADRAGTYVGQLIVNDGRVDSDPETVKIVVVQTDQQPPVVVSVTPSDAATNVDPATVVVAVFSETLLANSVNASTIELRDEPGQVIPGLVAYTADSLTVSLAPATPLAFSTTYTVALRGGPTGIRDAAGNPLATDVVWHFTTKAPPGPSPSALIVSPRGLSLATGASGQLRAALAFPDGSSADVTATAQWSSSDAAVVTVVAGTVSGVGSGSAVVTATASGLTASVPVQVRDGVALPPDPSWVAPAIDRTVPLDFRTATAFLYSGADPIQSGVAPGTIQRHRAAVLRGQVLSRDGSPMAEVSVTVARHPEYGGTRTRADGRFDLAVNGGGVLTVHYEKAGYLPAERQADVPWKDYVTLEPIVLVTADSVVTAVDLNAPATAQIARGAVVTDESGSRQATVVFPPATTATLVLPDGTQQALSAAHVRATEFTVGPTGQAAMPAKLPPSSAYTYAVDLSVDEAAALGARGVAFSQPVPFYVDNFLGFPVGQPVPVGYYDFSLSQWAALPNGRVVQILGVSGGRAQVDIDGSGSAASAAALAALQFTDAELERLVTLYPVGKSLWRVALTHFSVVDLNWPLKPPPGAETPSVRGTRDKKPRCESTQQGSIIGCESQTLGERLPLQGTGLTLNYRSSRVPGRQTGNRLELALSGLRLPSGVKRVDLRITVAGREYRQSFAPAPNLSEAFTWDGSDVYGRAVQGLVPATVTVGYAYDGQYGTPADGPRSFALPAGAGIGWNVARAEIVMEQTLTASLGTWDASAVGLGGWTVSVHHAYDPSSSRLYCGDGEERDGAERLALQTTGYAGTGTTAGGNGDGGPATAAVLRYPRTVRVAPDGTVYVYEEYWGGYGALRRIDTTGTISTVATNIGPATAIGPDGAIYGSNYVTQTVWRLTPGGVPTVIAGIPGSRGFSGDGGPATAAKLDHPGDVALGRDGAVYVCDVNNARIRRIGPDGIITTFAGNGMWDLSGDGGPATAAAIGAATTVAVGPDGRVYLADVDTDRIRQVSVDGMITTVVGTGESGFSGDGGPATAARLQGPMDVNVTQDGTIYFGDWYNQVVRRVGTDGIITTIAGGGTGGFGGQPGPALLTPIGNPSSVAVGGDGALFIANASGNRVLRVGPALPGTSTGSNAVPSESGGEVYVFDESGRHQRTTHSLTGETLFAFAYDAGGRLTSITDGDGNETRIERAGAPAIIAPGGQRTTLAIGADGYLAAAANTAVETWRMSYVGGGLLASLKDPKGGERTMQYDAAGRLTYDANAAGGSWSIARSGAGDETVTMTTAEARTYTYRSESLPDGGEIRMRTSPSGLVATGLTEANGRLISNGPDGSSQTLVPAADPRWGMQAEFAKSLSFRTPSGLTSETTVSREAGMSDPTNPMSVDWLLEDVWINGKWYEWYYERASNTTSYWTPLNRRGDERFDAQGRTIEWTPDGLLGVQYGYDSRGRVTTVRQGTRQTTIAYDSSNRPASFTDPLNRTVTFGYDAADRITSQTLPDGRVIGFAYDANGNVTHVVPPGRPAHVFSYTTVDLARAYTPPAVPGTGATTYTYNHDQQLTQVNRPGGDAIVLSYDGAGRVGTATFDAGSISLGYQPTGEIQTISAPGESLAYTFDGPLPLTSTWTGSVAGVVGYGYTNDFAVSSESVNGTTVAFGYDDDGMLTQAGELALSRHATHGLLTGTSLRAVTDQYEWTGYAEPARYQAAHPSFGTYPVFEAQYTRDDAGRLTQVIETVDTIQRVWSYTYDDAGRLIVVRRNGEVSAAYGYDANGNRLTYDGDRGHEEGTYDDQDRLVTYGNATFAYAPNGELQSKTIDGQVTHYVYDALGGLRHVTLPNGTVIEYVVDGHGRRVGKKVNGTVVKGWLYADQLRIVAELDGSGAVISRFVYGSKANVPDYVVRNGVTYRLVSDHLGSPRVVLDADTGAVVQRLDYDAFGIVRQDTNPGFQPFGFAGGLFDTDTGLIRFGTRDYDPVPGRWTTKDPISFLGRQTNLFAYVGNDPANWVDPPGLWFGVDDAVFVATGAVVGLAGRGVGDLLTGRWSSLEDYAGAAVGGALGAETLLYTANPFLAGAVAGLAGNGTGQGLKMLTGKRCSFDWGSTAFDTAFGAATGFIPGRPRIPGINAGRGSALQTFRDITTKARNGTINNVSPRTAAKMAAGAMYEYAFGQGAAAGAVASTVVGSIF